jgi:hypothetical protein
MSSAVNPTTRSDRMSVASGNVIHAAAMHWKRMLHPVKGPRTAPMIHRFPFDDSPGRWPGLFLSALAQFLTLIALAPADASWGGRKDFTPREQKSLEITDGVRALRKGPHHLPTPEDETSCSSR